jgi:uncharacterized protein (TIGR02118 family)
MVKLSVLYANAPGCTFDMDYYLNTHMRIVREQLGPALKGVQVEQGLGGVPPGVPAPFLAAGHLLFDSLEAFQASFTATAAAAIQGDIPNYTNVPPILQMGEVKL